MPYSVPRWRVAQAINQLGFIAADFAGGGIENRQAGVSISLDTNYFGATPETKDPACC